MDGTEDTNAKNENQRKNERRWLRSFVFCFLVGMGVVLDQLLKFLIFHHSVRLPLTHFQNSQFAFSLPLPVWLMFAVYAIVLVAALIFFAKRFFAAGKLELIAWALLFSGAVSNIGERIVLGYVRDYFFMLNGIFNLADFFILLGIVLLLFTVKQ